MHDGGNTPAQGRRIQGGQEIVQSSARTGIWVCVLPYPEAALPRDDFRRTIVGAVNMLVDITDRKRAEEELRLVNARVDLAVRGTNIGIWDIDMPDGDYWNGIVHDVNIWEQLGYERRDSPTDHVTSMVPVHPDDRALLEEAMRRYLAGETGTFEVEHRLRHKDGTYRWKLARGVAVRDAQGKPICFVGSGVDITDRKRAEEALAREREHRFRIFVDHAADAFSCTGSRAASWT